MILSRVLDEDIYNARDSCTSHATENIDYLTTCNHDVILQGGRPYCYSDASQTITSELAEVMR